MADHSVGARDESHEGEASQSLIFCFYNSSLKESLRVLLRSRSGLLYLAVLASRCVSECHENG